MAVAAWAANTAIALGVIRRSTALNNNGLFLNVQLLVQQQLYNQIGLKMLAIQ